MRTWLLFALLSFLFYSVYAQTWTPATNPGGGRVLDISVHSSGNILAGSFNGPYLSADDGVTWSSLQGNNQSFTAAKVRMNNSGHLFWDAGYSLFFSSDNGVTWTEISNGNWTYTGDILLNANDDIFIATNNDNIWRSTDNGSNWTQLTNIPGAEALGINSQQVLFASYNRKIYKSTDNGENWTILYSDPNLSTTVREFAFDGDNTIYGVIWHKGVLKSDDGGSTWNYVNNGLPIEYTNTINVGNSGEVFVGRVLFDGTAGGIYRSTDGGSSWAEISDGLTDKSILTIDVTSTGTILAGTESGGVFRRDQGSSSWVLSSTGFEGVYINLIKADSDGDIFAATNAGVYRSTDGANSWSWSIQGLNDTDIEYLEVHPDGSLYAADGDKIYRSTDKGATWIDLTNGVPGGEVEVQGIAFTSVGDVFLTTDGLGVIRSTDNGQTWNYANNGLPDPDVRDIISNSNDVLFLSDGISVFRSTDSGDNWIEITNQLPDGDVEEFGVGQNDVLFAATYSDGLFRSTDNGDNWTLTLDTDIISIDANGSEIFAGSDLILGGVYYSADNGLTWEEANDGLPSLQIESLNYRPGDKLYAVIRDNGIYSGDITTGINDPVNNPPGKFTLDQNYPNPFNPSTKITFTIPSIIASETKQSPVTLKIYDILGNEVATLVDEYKPSGSYEVEFNANGLTSGVYFYRLQISNYVETKKMILLQ